MYARCNLLQPAMMFNCVILKIKERSDLGKQQYCPEMDEPGDIILFATVPLISFSKYPKTYDNN